MKFILVASAWFAASVAQAAVPVKPQQVEAELGASLGFQIFRFEAQLEDDEVLVIHHTTTSAESKLEMEEAHVSGGQKVPYEIVVVDSGAFHPSLRGTYMIRYSGYQGFINGVRLGLTTKTQTDVTMVFNVLDSNTPKVTEKWWAAVEKFSEIAKRWPGLAPHKPGEGYVASRALTPVRQPGQP